VAAGTNYAAADGTPQSFTVSAAVPGGSVVFTNSGLRGGHLVTVTGSGWNTNHDTSVTLYECTTTVYAVSSCDNTNSVTTPVGTGTKVGQLHAAIALGTGTIDGKGDTCGLAASGSCYLVAVGNTGDQTVTMPLIFGLPSVTLGKTSAVPAQYLDKVTTKNFPVGDTVVAEECDAATSVPATLGTHCDPATAVTATVTTGGAVAFAATGIELLAGPSFSDAASGSCAFGGICRVVVLDQSNPSIWFSPAVTFAVPGFVVSKTTGALGNTLDKVTATGMPVGDTVMAEQCDATVSVPASVATNCDASTAVSGTVGPTGNAVFSAGGVTLLVGSSYSDTAGGSCGPADPCQVVLTDPGNAAIALSKSVSFAAPSAHATVTKKVVSGTADTVTALGFPVGDTVTAAECSTSVQVPSGISTNCDTATEISGTVSSSGAVTFSPPSLTVGSGSSYTESGLGSVSSGGPAYIVVADSSNPGLFVVIPITMA
jgi:hypothetical protein